MPLTSAAARDDAARPSARSGLAPLASNALVGALVLYGVLRSVAPLEDSAAEGMRATTLRELAVLAQASLLAGIAAGLAVIAVRALRRKPPAAVPVMWGLVGLLIGGAYIDSRFVLFFGRHSYHPATLELLLSPGSSDHSGLGLGGAALWTASWLAVIAAFSLFGRAVRHRAFSSLRVVSVLAALLAINAVREHVPSTAFASDDARLERFRSSLFLRGLMLGRAHAASDAADETYPLGPLGPAAEGERPDVLLIVIESLRADALEPETMPELSRHSASAGAFVGARHYAGANCTSNSFFTLLYGTNGATFVRFNDPARPTASAPLAWLRESGYTLGFYTSQLLEWRHMDDLFVRPAFDVVVEETEGAVWERDARLIERWFEDDPEGPSFAVLFFTSTHHDYSFPDERAPFQPSLRPLEVMQTDLRPFRTELVNRYRNSVSYVDSLVGMVLDRLAREGRLAQTRVIITGDHGEEFLEHGHLTHASSLVEEQIHVPLVALGVPGLAGRSEALTSHEQIVPTLLSSIAPGLAFANVGTGTPMLERAAMPIVSECADVPGQFVAIVGEQKDWLTIEPTSIRLDFVSDLHDVILEGGVASPETLARVRSEVGHFGGERSFTGELWPCPTVEAGGERFHVCERWIGFTEASELCGSHGLALVRLLDAEQNDALAALATSAEHEALWLGLSDEAHEGDFRWPDGTAPAFTRWAEGEPSNTGGREHCVQVGRDGAWNDRVCDMRERFACGPAPVP